VIDIRRTKDAEALRQIAIVQDAELRRLHDRLQALAKENAALKGLTGAELEAQLRLIEKEIAEATARAQGGSERRPHDREPRGEKKPQTGHGPTPQPELPIIDVTHKLDSADEVCTACGGHMDEWENQFEDSEEIDVLEIQYVRKRHRRQKYRCKCGAKIETALGPIKLIPGGRYSIDFAIHVAIAKYVDHLPLDRQASRMRRHGLEVTTQTLWDQTWALALRLEQTATRIHQHVLSQDVAIGDETHWKRLNERKNGFTWTLVTDTATSYKVLNTRSNEAADEMLAGFEGVLVTDGYVIYPSQSKKRGFVLAHDWCHVRRRIIDAEGTSPKEATAFLDDIGKLFAIEREIAERCADLEEKAQLELTYAVRQERSKPIVNAIGARAAELRTLPGTPLAKAITYLDNQWHGLIVFLADPRVPLTSNAAERALRSPVLGRKNYLGSRSDRGMKAAGILYTVLATALQNNLDPAKYVRANIEASLRNEQYPLPHELATET
jgi:transposase